MYVTVCILTRNNKVEELQTDNQKYLLSWAILSQCQCKPLDTRKLNFILCSKKSPNPITYITLRAHNKNGQSTDLPLPSSFLDYLHVDIFVYKKIRIIKFGINGSKPLSYCVLKLVGMLMFITYAYLYFCYIMYLPIFRLGN